MEDRSTAPMGLDLSRLRRGEITAVAGALIVLLGLFVAPWYAASSAHLEAAGAPGGAIPAESGKRLLGLSLAATAAVVLRMVFTPSSLSG
jgi:hypothetical protein